MAILPKPKTRTHERRSQEERTAEARRRILEAATYCFDRYGYHETSMGHIAKAAKVSRGLLHYHFENKEKLTLAIWEHAAAGIFVRMTALAPTAQPTVEWVSRLVDSLWAEFKKMGTLGPVAADMALRAARNPRARKRFREHIRSHSQLVERGVGVLLAPHVGDLPVSAQTIGDMFLIVVGGMALFSAVLDDDDSDTRINAALDGFKAFFLAQLFPAKAQAQAA